MSGAQIIRLSGLTDSEAHAVTVWCAKARDGLLDMTAQWHLTDRDELYVVVVGSDGEPQFAVCRERGLIIIRDASGQAIQRGTNLTVEDLIDEVRRLLPPGYGHAELNIAG